MQNAVSRFWRSLNREQKLSVGLFSVLAFVAVAFGFMQIRRNIIYPFTTPVDQLVKIKALFGPSDAEKEAQAKKTDSDGDGLSDWDEENAYHTSKYLADTDSDGVLDNTEIAKRTDPNCPSGQSCGYTYVPPDAVTLSNTSGTSSQTYGSALPLIPERSPASIRSYLRAQGVSEAQLAGYSDEMLLQAYDQSKQDFESSSSTTTTDSTMTPTTPAADSASVETLVSP